MCVCVCVGEKFFAVNGGKHKVKHGPSAKLPGTEKSRAKLYLQTYMLDLNSPGPQDMCAYLYMI